MRHHNAGMITNLTSFPVSSHVFRIAHTRCGCIYVDCIYKMWIQNVDTKCGYKMWIQMWIAYTRGGCIYRMWSPGMVSLCGLLWDRLASHRSPSSCSHHLERICDTGKGLSQLTPGRPCFLSNIHKTASLKVTLITVQTRHSVASCNDPKSVRETQPSLNVE